MVLVSAGVGNRTSVTLCRVGTEQRDGPEGIWTQDPAAEKSGANPDGPGRTSGL